MKKLIWMLLLLAPCQVAVASSDFDMIVTPSADVKAGEATLNFELKYKGTSPIMVARSSVPGVQDGAIWIGAEYFPDFGDNFHPCPKPIENVYIEDGLLGTMTIQPGQTITQAVKLSTRYANLQQILGKCDLVVFWSYKPELTTGAAERQAGSVVFPASK